VKPSEFLAEVVAVNSAALSQMPDDVRLGVNAILTADAFFGILFDQQQSGGKSTHTKDDQYRDSVASRSECYRVLRDTAFAIKHGELKGKKVRLVRTAGQVQRRETRWDDNGVWDESPWSDEAVMIETVSGDRVRVDKLVEEVLLVAEEELSPAGRPPATLAQIRLAERWERCVETAQSTIAAAANASHKRIRQMRLSELPLAESPRSPAAEHEPANRTR